MPLTAHVKDYIDSLTYEQLLRHWRFAPIGDLMFQGESGEYWQGRMQAMRVGMDTVAASKGVGW